MAVEYKLLKYKKNLYRDDLSSLEDEFNQLAQEQWRFVRFMPMGTFQLAIALFERDT